MEAAAESDRTPIASMKPTEMHHATEPCAYRAGGSSGAARLKVKINREGAPLEAHVELVGGYVSASFLKCVEAELMKNRYEPRGDVVVLAVDVHI
jgi:hypothetical protein